MIENKQVVLDLSQVKDVDSAGLGTLASLHLLARQLGHSFVLKNPVMFVRDLLALTQLDRQLQVRRVKGRSGRRVLPYSNGTCPLA